MAGQAVVKQVTAEIRANTQELDAALARSEGKLKSTKRQVEGAGGAAATVGRQYGSAATQIASATEAIARNGRVTGEAAKQLLQQGSAIAFAFGPAGAIIGALSIFGLAVATAMGRARAEVRDLADSFDEELRVLSSRLDYRGSGALLTRVLVGDPRAERRELQIPFAEFEREVVALREKVARASQVPLGEQGGLGIAADRSRLRELEPLLVERQRQVEEAQKAFDEAAQREQERLGNERASIEREKALNEERARVERARTEALRNETQAREQLQREALEFGRDFDRLVLEELGTNAEQIAASFDALIARGTKAEGADSPRVRQLEELKQSAVSAASAIEDSEATIRELDLLLASGSQPTADTFAQLTADADRLRAELSRLTKGSKEFLATQQQLLAVEQKRSALLNGVAASDSGGKSESRTDAARTTADLSREIQQAVDGALQLAAAFGGVERSAANALRAVSQIAGNLPALQTALKAKDGLGVISAGLPIVGALASLLGDSPEDAARREEIRRNTEALQELTRTAGLLGVGVSGDQSRSASAAVRAVLDRTANAPPNARLNLAGVGAFTFAEFGLTFKELEEIAAGLGITLSNNRESFEAFAAALEDTITKLGEFGTDLASSTRQAETEIDLYGITDPKEAARIRNNAFAGRSPLADELLAFDLNTPEGRAAARAFGLKIFEVIKAGGDSLTREQLGGLDGDEFLAFLDQYFAGLDAIDAAEGTTTSTATRPDRMVTADRTQITADQASRILGLNATQVSLTREIRDLLVTAFRAATTPLPLPSAAVFATPAGAGAVVNITIENNVYGNATDPSLLDQRQLDLITEHIKRALGQDVAVRRQYSGKVTVS